MRSVATVALAALLAAGCADRTGILVEVTSGDLVVPDDVDGLRFQVDSTSGRTVDRTFALDGAWPHSLTIVPADDRDRRAELTVRVIGRRGGDAVIRRVITGVRFVDGETRVLSVELGRDCLGMLCDGDLDCVAGMCVGAEVDGGVDAGATDAGTDAATPDGGGMDSGMDAGADAGPDGGTDAGADAGTDAGTDAGAGGIADHVVISEVATEGPDGLTDEFVELYNPTAIAVDIGGLALEYRAGTGSGFTARALVPAGSTIPAHGYYLIASDGYGGTVSPDLPAAWSSYFSSTAGHVRIVMAGTEVDRLGWGTAIAPEGRPQPRLTDPSNQTYERKAVDSSTSVTMASGGRDELRGNGFDADDNATDFIHRAARDPQNSFSPAETP